MSQEIENILEIINPEIGRGRIALSNSLLSLKQYDQRQLLNVVADYKEKFTNATPEYRSRCAYILTGIIGDMNESDDLSTRVEVELFMANLPENPNRKEVHRAYAEEASTRLPRLREPHSYDNDQDAN